MDEFNMVIKRLVDRMPQHRADLRVALTYLVCHKDEEALQILDSVKDQLTEVDLHSATQILRNNGDVSES